MFVCEKNSSCCNYQYADRLDQIDEEFRDCGNLIEVEPVKHGKWVPTIDQEFKDDDWKCSLCCTLSKKSNYCPNCGAKMNEVEK